MRKRCRQIGRLVRLAKAFCLAFIESKPRSDARDRADWQQRQARRMLAALDVEVEVTSPLPTGGLVLCNHLSYLDIVVIAAQGPAVFVAKSDVGKWPVIGGLLERGGAILAERERPLTAGKTAAEIRHSIENHLPVILFPEGTSSDGACVLPFKPTLLQAAIDAHAEITPAAVFYRAEGGEMKSDVCYWGDDTFFPHLIRLAGLDRVTAQVTFGTSSLPDDNRKRAAHRYHLEVSRRLDDLKSGVSQD